MTRQTHCISCDTESTKALCDECVMKHVGYEAVWAAEQVDEDQGSDYTTIKKWHQNESEMRDWISDLNKIGDWPHRLVRIYIPKEG